ncbi:MAG: hypothetical protein AABX30_00570 [Nanoarchaeota archaeon]
MDCFNYRDNVSESKRLGKGFELLQEAYSEEIGSPKELALSRETDITIEPRVITRILSRKEVKELCREPWDEF